MEKSKVYFTSKISPESLVDIYEKLGIDLKGKVAVKLHSGEHGNRNYLRPEFVKAIVEKVNGTVVECNTAYPGERDTTEKHEIPDGVQIKKNYVGKHLANYDSILVLSHFKGHAMGGFGGALKQLSIGCASSYGKNIYMEQE